MPLLKLPNELLLGIMEYVWPEDDKYFSMVCKRVHELSGPMVREHRKSKLDHSYLEIIKETLPSTLSDYCTGFYRLGQYPTQVDILPWDAYSPFTQVRSGTLDRLRVMAKKTSLLPDHRVQHWFGEIFSSDVAIRPFILPTVPNLQTLKLIGRKRKGLQCVEEFVNAAFGVAAPS